MDYHAYVIRLWRAGAHGPWRISLQNTATGERKGFASVDEAAEYLSGEIEQAEMRPAKWTKADDGGEEQRFS
ncbi:MAG: hypothetical protein ACOYYS_08930 [Chloroflexota bacterium]